MTDEAASALEIASTLAIGTPLPDRLARVNQASFGGDPEIQALYRDLFGQLIAEAEGVPGYSTAMAMLLERFAFLWASQRADDLADNPLNPREYDKVIQRFRQLWEGLLKARDDRQADDQFKHAFVTAFLRMFVSVLDEEVEPEVANRIQAKVVERLQTIEVQGTETNRRNRA